MEIQAGLTQFAEYLGSEIRRVENKIPTASGQVNAPANSQIITGDGRPDRPETTAGKITGNEPNGTFYNSTNGGGSGTYLWHKQAGKWTVIYGDTGYKQQSQAVNIKQGYVALRRVNNTVECHFSGGPWGGISFYGSANPKFRRKSHAKRMDILGNSQIPIGFRPDISIMVPFYNDDGDHIGMVYVGGRFNYNYIELRFAGNVPSADLDAVRLPILTWMTNEPFPSS